MAGFQAGRRDRIHLPLDILAAFSALFTISRAHSTPKYVSVRIDRRSLACVDSARFIEELPTVFFVEHRVLDWAT